MQINKKQAFTLVELIVVITILAILWTIAFLSLQWYSRDSRDAVRISDMKNIETWLWVFNAKSWTYPQPENKVDITASWTVISYQWYFWEKNMWIIKMSNWWKDPLDKEYYTYSTNANQTKYELLWFLENGKQTSYVKDFVNQANASDLTNRFITTNWSDIWILLNSTTNEPIQKSWSWIDVVNTNNNYKLIVSNTESVSWTWWVLFWKIYNSREDLINNKIIASLDSSLVWYWDMESTILSWSTLMLKDLSKYWNHWYCYNSWTLVNCWTAWNWPQFVDWNWKSWKAMSFDWIDDWIDISNLINLNSWDWRLGVILPDESTF